MFFPKKIYFFVLGIVFSYNLTYSVAECRKKTVSSKHITSSLNSKDELDMEGYETDQEKS